MIVKMLLALIVVQREELRENVSVILYKYKLFLQTVDFKELAYLSYVVVFRVSNIVRM